MTGVGGNILNADAELKLSPRDRVLVSGSVRGWRCVPLSPH